MTRSKKLRVLRALHARVPEVGCKGLCVDSCTTIPMTVLERDQIEIAIGRAVTASPLEDGHVLLGDVGAPCELLVLGRCTAYAQRPTICRLFGAADGLRCQHGCAPERRMSDAEVRRLIDEVAAL